MSDEDAKQLALPEYWDGRYLNVGPDQQVHEWFRSFADLEPFFERHLFGIRGPDTAPKILHLGSGDSTIPVELFAKGYKNQLCIDFSSVVVDKMSKSSAQEGISWEQGDVRHMDQVPSGSVDVAFDKGTLDAMIHGSPWDPPADVLSNTHQYIREVFRVLKENGTFLYITYRQPHFIKPLLSFPEVSWDLEVEILGGSDSSFGYHGFTLKKASTPVVP